MEDMSGWDLATAAIYYGPLDDPKRLFETLVSESLLRDHPGDEQAFVAAVQAHSDLIRGGSPAARIVSRLRKEGRLMPRADLPDPFGKRAKELWQQALEASAHGKK